MMARTIPGRPGRDGRDGKDGRAGRDCDMEEVRRHLTAEVQRFIDALPPSAPAVDVPLLERKILAAVEARLERVPLPKNGRDGRDGEDGHDGEDGRDGQDADMDLLLREMRDAVTVAIEAIPDAKDGQDGEDGAAGRPPRHEWRGYSLRFENPDGTWGDWKNLQGPRGPAGSGGGGAYLPPTVGEAPQDDRDYVRRNGAWHEAATGGGGNYDPSAVNITGGAIDVSALAINGEDVGEDLAELGAELETPDLVGLFENKLL